MAVSKTPSQKGAPTAPKKGTVTMAKAAPAKAVAKPAARQKKKPSVSAGQRTHYVEVAAYYIAERRGFAPGDAMQDWLDAEEEIDRLIASGKLG